MLFDGENSARFHERCLFGLILYSFHLETYRDEFFGEFFGCDVDVDVIFEPRNGCKHYFSTSPLNCLRKRTSFS